MLDEISSAKTEISKYLSGYFAKSSEETVHVNKWAPDLHNRLEKFMTQAKMLRGGLIVTTHKLLNGKNDEAALMSAAAIELMHSSLLIHDDIMDRDQLRRGESTVYYQYEKLAEERKYLQPAEFGRAMGICAGDEAFFMAYDILSQLPVEKDMLHTLLAKFTKEMKQVGLAQMEDVHFGHNKDEPTEQEILKVFYFKTARYTFSLPFFMGGCLVGLSNSELVSLEAIGEALGVIFQIKDDELGLFGSEKVIGKPSGSDLREDKKTLFRLYLKEMAGAKEQSKLKKIYGSLEITEAEVQYVRDLCEELGVMVKVQRKVREYADYVQNEAASLNEAQALKPLISDLLAYSLTRDY